jgi:fluoride ion exporter CrcB/FEX
MWKSVVAVCVGASLGALLRWWLGAQLNSFFPTIPPGTLASNLVGGYLVGIAPAFRRSRRNGASSSSPVSAVVSPRFRPFPLSS